MRFQPKAKAGTAKTKQAEYGRLSKKGWMKICCFSDIYSYSCCYWERISIVAIDARIAATIKISSTKPGGWLLYLCRLLFFCFTANRRSFPRTEFRLLNNAFEIVQLALEMANPLLILFLFSSFWFTGLEWFSKTTDVALCKLGSMTHWDAVYSKDLFDLSCEVSERLVRWNHSNGFNKLLIFCWFSCLSVPHFNYKIYSCYLKSRESFYYPIDNLFQPIDFPHLIL